MVAAFPALVLMPGNTVFPSKNHTRASDLPPVSQVSVCRWENLCVGPSKEHLGFQFLSVSPRGSESPLVFGNSSFLAWDPGLESSQLKPRISLSFREASAALLSPDPPGFPPPPVGVSPAEFATVSLLLALMQLLLYIIRCTYHGQLVILYVGYSMIWLQFQWEPGRRQTLLLASPPSSPKILISQIWSFYMSLNIN